MPPGKRIQKIRPIEAEADLVQDRRLGVIRKEITPSYFSQPFQMDAPASLRCFRENVARVNFATDVATAFHPQDSEFSQDGRKGRGISPSTLEANEAGEAGRHGLGNSFFAVDRRQVAEHDIGVSLDGGIQEKKIVVR